MKENGQDLISIFWSRKGDTHPGGGFKYFFNFHPYSYMGKMSNLTLIFARGWGKKQKTSATRDMSR